MECTINARSDAACFVGNDLHKDTLTVCTIDVKDRAVSCRKISCVAREKVCEFLAGLPRPSVVAIETGGLYRGLWTDAEPIVDQDGSRRRLQRHRLAHDGPTAVDPGAARTGSTAP